jgi:hypothetical protein
MKNKSSHMFASLSRKDHDPTKANISPGPAAYKNENVTLDKKDFSRPFQVFVGPTRNLDGAVAKAGANPSI